MISESQALARRVVEALLHDDRATLMLGMAVVSVDAGAACIEMTVRHDMLNGHRTCHGGILFALADTAFACACNSRNQRAVAAAAQIDFLRPAVEGDILRATAVELSAGRRLGLYDVNIADQQGRTVAVFRGKSCSIRGTVIDQAPVVQDASG
jgi:acyl-CoA thioesterase